MDEKQFNLSNIKKILFFFIIFLIIVFLNNKFMEIDFLYIITLIAAMVGIIGFSVSVFLFLNKLTKTAFDYIGLWVFWGFTLFFLGTSRIINYSHPNFMYVPMHPIHILFIFFTLFFNSLAFLQLKRIFYFGKINSIRIKIDYIIIIIVYFISLFIAIFFTKSTAIFLLISIIHSIYITNLSYTFKKFWFFLSGLGFILYYSITVFYIFVFGSAVNSGWAQFICIIYTICAIIGTIIEVKNNSKN